MISARKAIARCRGRAGDDRRGRGDHRAGRTRGRIRRGERAKAAMMLVNKWDAGEPTPDD